MFSNVNFVLGAINYPKAECEATFIEERWRTNIKKHKKTIEKDQRRPLKFTIIVKY